MRVKLPAATIITYYLLLITYFNMWLLLAFLSATLLGFYDVFKKQSLKDNAVLPVLFLNTLFSSLIFLPFILVSAFEPDLLGGTIFNVPVAGWEQHKYIIIKSFIVLSSWIFGYFGMKHLPITIVGPINATRPVMVLVGAMLVFGERLNLYQWIGVMLAVASFFMLSRSGKKEGIDFKHNKWILFIILAAVMGAVSGLYDKYLMKSLNPKCLCIRPISLVMILSSMTSRSTFLVITKSCSGISTKQSVCSVSNIRAKKCWFFLLGMVAGSIYW